MKRKRLDKASALTLLLVLALAVTALAAPKSTKITTASINKNKKYTVELWAFPHHGVYEQILKEQIAEFNKIYPNITVNYQINPWDEGARKFDIALNAGDPPDIYQGVLESKYLNTGLLVPVNDMLTDADLRDFEPGAMKLFKTEDGKYYGFPMWVSLHCWAANKQLLEEAKVPWKKIQQSGWTFEEFEKYAKKLTKPDNGQGRAQWGFVTDFQNGVETLDHLMKGSGIMNVADTDGTFLWTGPKAVEAVKVVTRLLADKSMPPQAAAINSQARDDMFWNWEAAIIGRAGPYILSTRAVRQKSIKEGKITPHPKGDPEIVLLPLPHSKDAKEWARVASTAQMVFKKAGKAYKGDDQTAAAMALAKFLVGDLGGFHANRLMVIPSRKSVQKKWSVIPEKYKDLLPAGVMDYVNDPNGKFMVRYAKQGTMPILVQLEYAEAKNKTERQSIAQYFPAVLMGAMTPEQYIDQITKDAKGFGLK